MTTVEALSTQGWHIDEKALDALLEYEEEQLDLKRFLLNNDLKDYGAPVIINKVDLNAGVLEAGNYVFQLNRQRNVSHPRMNEASHQSGIYKYTFSDGHATVLALRFHPITGLTEKVMPGTKVLLTGPIRMEAGLLLIDQSNCKVLGGNVEKLIQGWQMEQHGLYLSRPGGDRTGAPKWRPFATKQGKAKGKKNKENGANKPHKEKPFKTADVLKQAAGVVERSEDAKAADEAFESSRKAIIDSAVKERQGPKSRFKGNHTLNRSWSSSLDALSRSNSRSSSRSSHRSAVTQPSSYGSSAGPARGRGSRGRGRGSSRGSRGTGGNTNDRREDPRVASSSTNNSRGRGALTFVRSTQQDRRGPAENFSVPPPGRGQQSDFSVPPPGLSQNHNFAAPPPSRGRGQGQHQRGPPNVSNSSGPTSMSDTYSFERSNPPPQLKRSANPPSQDAASTVRGKQENRISKSRGKRSNPPSSQRDPVANHRNFEVSQLVDNSEKALSKMSVTEKSEANSQVFDAMEVVMKGAATNPTRHFTEVNNRNNFGQQQSRGDRGRRTYHNSKPGGPVAAYQPPAARQRDQNREHRHEMRSAPSRVQQQQQGGKNAPAEVAVNTARSENVKIHFSPIVQKAENPMSADSLQQEKKVRAPWHDGNYYECEFIKRGPADLCVIHYPPPIDKEACVPIGYLQEI